MVYSDDAEREVRYFVADDAGNLVPRITSYNVCYTKLLREVVTLLAGMPYPVGSVLGKITASGKYTLSPATGADGSQVAIV